MMDFLIFKRFISIEALIIFYYIGAIVLPVGVYFIISYLIVKNDYAEKAFVKGKEKIWSVLTKTQRVKLLVSFASIFLLSELFWRMLFEFLIAYIQIRDALLQI